MGKKKTQTGPLTARTKWRMRAVEILYEAESRDEPVETVLAERAKRAAEDPEAPRLPAYAAQLVQGVADHIDEIDAGLTESASGWAVDRMPAVDRNVLRMGLYEIRFVDDVDAPVAIKEALRVAEQIGSSDDPAFINAVLDKAAHTEAERGED
ncbi:transcription antitermination factor NusB [Glycomyces sp. L485]|uniref:transcription antitermination factor NusB n=1 Tax=Glycomyces sp. L485 TaxID=2909235 RepID=UPI001F4AC505|nr:transcription antitermination factor NusB [Glycomyces sp. L485]